MAGIGRSEQQLVREALEKLRKQGMAQITEWGRAAYDAILEIDGRSVGIEFKRGRVGREDVERLIQVLALKPVDEAVLVAEDFTDSAVSTASRKGILCVPFDSVSDIPQTVSQSKRMRDLTLVLSGMNSATLRDLASEVGVSYSGPKQRLIHRLRQRIDMKTLQQKLMTQRGRCYFIYLRPSNGYEPKERVLSERGFIISRHRELSREITCFELVAPRTSTLLQGELKVLGRQTPVDWSISNLTSLASLFPVASLTLKAEEKPSQVRRIFLTLGQFVNLSDFIRQLESWMADATLVRANFRVGKAIVTIQKSPVLTVSLLCVHRYEQGFLSFLSSFEATIRGGR